MSGAEQGAQRSDLTAGTLPWWAQLPPARNWWQVFLLALCVLTGLQSVLRPEAVVPNLDRAFPDAAVAAWAWCLLVGGLVALTGVAVGPKPLGILIERVGLLILFGACLAYPVALVLLLGWPAVWDRAATIAVFAAVVGQRIVRITRLVHLVTRGRSL